MKIGYLHLLILLISILGLYFYGIGGLWLTITLYLFLEIFVGNATMHRFYGHRSFKMASWKETILRWLAHHIGIGSVIGWVGYHRWHHKYSDTEKDIHSPKIQGIGHILFGSWKARIPPKLVNDLVKDKNLIWWHKNYYAYHTAVILTLLMLSPYALVFAYALPNLLCLLSAYAIAIFPHLEGEAKNDLFTEIITFGEGNHKYHHDNPSEYRYSKYDVTGIAIKTFLKND